MSDANLPQPINRMCPALTIAAALNPRKPADGVEAPGVAFTGVPCQGITCAMFVPTTDEKGAMTGGGCAPTMIVQVLDSHAGQTGAVLKVLASRAKIGLAPGIMG